MDILLTGGLGYIGSHLYKKLLENLENNIIVLDNFSNSLREWPKNKNLSVIEGDIRDNKIVDRLVNNIDIIIHLAAQINISKSIKDPINDANNNINGTLNLLEAMRKSEIEIERFIYISSAAVYGIPIHIPINENHLVNPISPYGQSKLTGERYSMLYHSLYKLPVTSLRLFNVFGPNTVINSYSGVITKFIDNVKKDQSPIVFGDGNQIRDFVFIEDIVNAIILTIENKKSIGEIFNIGTGKPSKIKDLAEIIIKISDKKLHPVFKDPIIGDIIESVADISKAKKILDYEPTYNLERGLSLCY